MTSKEALTISINANLGDKKSKKLFSSQYGVIVKQLFNDLEVLEQLEILKKYYPPFKEFLENMFEKGHNEDLIKIKEWIENE